MSKAFIVYHDGARLTRIKYEGGGEVPKELSGSYTSAKAAKAAIERYEHGKKPSRKDLNRTVKDASSKDAA